MIWKQISHLIVSVLVHSLDDINFSGQWPVRPMRPPSSRKTDKQLRWKRVNAKCTYGHTPQPVGMCVASRTQRPPFRAYIDSTLTLFLSPSTCGVVSIRSTACLSSVMDIRLLACWRKGVQMSKEPQHEDKACTYCLFHSDVVDRTYDGVNTSEKSSKEWVKITIGGIPSSEK